MRAATGGRSKTAKRLTARRYQVSSPSHWARDRAERQALCSAERRAREELRALRQLNASMGQSMLRLGRAWAEMDSATRGRLKSEAWTVYADLAAEALTYRANLIGTEEDLRSTAASLAAQMMRMG